MGKKAKKNGKISEEERLRASQHQAQVEAEKKRQKEELISLFLKNKLKCEDVFQRINILKINQEWRQLLRQNKREQLSVDIKTQWDWIDKTVMSKNRQIEFLTHRLDDGEVQYARNFQTYAKNLDKIIYIYKNQLYQMNIWFEKQKQNLIVQFRKELAREDCTSRERLRALIEWEQVNLAKWNSSNRSEFIDKTIGIVSKTATDTLVQLKSNEINGIIMETMQCLDEYLKRSEIKRKEHQQLSHIDKQSKTLLNQQTLIIQKQLSAINNLKNHYVEFTNYKESLIKTLINKKITLLKYFNQCEKSSLSAKKQDMTALKQLVIIYHNTYNSLSGLWKKIGAIEHNLKISLNNSTFFDDNLLKNADFNQSNGVSQLKYKIENIQREISLLKIEKENLLKFKNHHSQRLKSLFWYVTLTGDTRTETISTTLMLQDPLVLDSLRKMPNFTQK